MVVFRVPSMRCGGCAHSVTSALRGVDPAAEVRVDLGRREVTVQGAADAVALACALREAGFEGERLAA
ncbi:heavy-metal-associated domain-containing protein [Siccirubricoccus sp. KC 17139]|uniref:Heavy-metal-associated domain-containing protein n=1 Tax=Siccirubricoccus soli TaxID=2899147 RepID=A0ABT1D1Q1_9PROT|nr:heavy-metal-associated domain-containing protein [Siccirubricoccus soli]MCO6415819.1 heavy-metal-associated domain-containing protein [Siccirubricoccus soli]MCP2681951.1 heavy-metal-associated domain-containing protein [Siccirubricoccus soli]